MLKPSNSNVFQIEKEEVKKNGITKIVEFPTHRRLPIRPEILEQPQKSSTTKNRKRDQVTKYKDIIAHEGNILVLIWKIV